MSPSLKVMSILQLLIEIGINFVFLSFLIYSFCRLSELVKHEGLALSKIQMFGHVSVFAVTEATILVFVGALIKFKIHATDLQNVSARL